MKLCRKKRSTRKRLLLVKLAMSTRKQIVRMKTRNPRKPGSSRRVF
jgi:hypothetical protein